MIMMAITMMEMEFVTKATRLKTTLSVVEFVNE
jgi:hypothetical protein